jgi:hypothetical protein
VIPSETDTFDAAVRAVDAGAGLQLDHKAINAKMVAATSYSILTLHDKYAAAAKKVGQILLAAGRSRVKILICGSFARIIYVIFIMNIGTDGNFIRRS